MKKSSKVLCFAVVLILILGVTAMANNRELKSTRPEVQFQSQKLISGVDEPGDAGSPSFSPSRFAPPPQPPGDTVGTTYYEFQHNGSMGRQVVFAPSVFGTPYVHFVWMCRTSPTGTRTVYYNSRNLMLNSWIYGSGVGSGQSFTGANGGYTTIDVNATGQAVAAWHEGPPGNYLPHVGADKSAPAPIGTFGAITLPGPRNTVALDPANCDGIQSGSYEINSEYLWPVVDFDLIGGDSVFHVIACENPGPDAPLGEIQSYIYYRVVNDTMDACPGAPDDTLGYYIDESYDISPVIRSDPNSDKVAIVYTKYIYPEGSPQIDCNYSTQWINDVVYRESTDGGVTWGTVQNITNYSQSGSLPVSEMEYMAYTDVTALYDHLGTLHIVWNTPRYVVGECSALYQAMMWHWDDQNQAITPVYDATNPYLFRGPSNTQCSNTGAWNIMVSKPNISECDEKLYVSFTRFGAHPDTTEGVVHDSVGGDYSDLVFLNGDIFLTASSDGGITWGPDATAPPYDFFTTAGTGTPVKQGTAVDITNTFTNGCVAGDCHSEHWATMSKYSTGVVHIEYIDDNHPGASVFTDPCQEGEVTNNALMWTTYDCFVPEGTFGYAVEPTSAFVPIAPNGAADCTIDYTADLTITVRNTGNVPINYTSSGDQTWIQGTPSGTITAGINPSADLVFTIGAIATEGEFSGTITINLTSTAGNATVVVNVTAHVECKYYVPEYTLLSTQCWSVGVWNVPRSGIAQRGDDGNMFWFVDSVAPMYDNGVIITDASNYDNTYFSIFDGSNSNADFAAVGPLIVQYTEYPDYEYAHGQWATPDTSIVGFIEYFAPKHPDSCFLIERFTVYNNTSNPITIDVGEGIDWDFPDGEDGSVNESGVDAARGMVYQKGPSGVSPEEDYYGGVSFTRPIVGALVLENDVWVYPNSGYYPDTIGALLDTLTPGTFMASDSVEDLNSVYVVDQQLTLAPGECKAYSKVKASSLSGLADLQSLIDKGKVWAADRYLDEAECYPTPDTAMANSPIGKHNTIPPAKSAVEWIGSGWHELMPTFCENTTVVDAVDNGTPGLNHCDYLKFRQDDPPNDEWWEHVYWVTWTLVLTPAGGGDPIYFDMMRGAVNQIAGQTPVRDDAITYPWRSYWVEVANPLGRIISIVAWQDNGNGYLDECDYIVVQVVNWPWCYIETYHVEDLQVDIWSYLEEPPACVPGDADGSGAVDIDDVVYLINYIFGGGPPPVGMDCCGDADGSGNIDIDDVVYLINYIFGGGPAPDPSACIPPWK